MVAEFPEPLKASVNERELVVFPIRFKVVADATFNAVPTLLSVMVLFAVDAGAKVRTVPLVETVMLPNVTVGTLVTETLPPVLKVTKSPPAGPPA